MSQEVKMEAHAAEADALKTETQELGLDLDVVVDLDTGVATESGGLEGYAENALEDLKQSSTQALNRFGIFVGDALTNRSDVGEFLDDYWDYATDQSANAAEMGWATLRIASLIPLSVLSIGGCGRSGVTAPDPEPEGEDPIDDPVLPEYECVDQKPVENDYYQYWVGARPQDAAQRVLADFTIESEQDIMQVAKLETVLDPEGSWGQIYEAYAAIIVNSEVLNSYLQAYDVESGAELPPEAWRAMEATGMMQRLQAEGQGCAVIPDQSSEAHDFEHDGYPERQGYLNVFEEVTGLSPGDWQVLGIHGMEYHRIFDDPDCEPAPDKIAPEAACPIGASSVHFTSTTVRMCYWQEV